MPPWMSVAADGTLLLQIAVQPGARKPGFAGFHGSNGERLKLKVAAPPVDGKANEAVVEFLADFLDTASRQIEIVRGQSSRQKTVAISGLGADFVARRVEESFSRVEPPRSS